MIKTLNNNYTKLPDICYVGGIIPFHTKINLPLSLFYHSRVNTGDVKSFTKGYRSFTTSINSLSPLLKLVEAGNINPGFLSGFVDAL